MPTRLPAEEMVNCEPTSACPCLPYHVPGLPRQCIRAGSAKTEVMVESASSARKQHPQCPPGHRCLDMKRTRLAGWSCNPHPVKGTPAQEWTAQDQWNTHQTN